MRQTHGSPARALPREVGQTPDDAERPSEKISEGRDLAFVCRMDPKLLHAVAGRLSHARAQGPTRRCAPIRSRSPSYVAMPQMTTTSSAITSSDQMG